MELCEFITSIEINDARYSAYDISGNNRHAMGNILKETPIFLNKNCWIYPESEIIIEMVKTNGTL